MKKWLWFFIFALLMPCIASAGSLTGGRQAPIEFTNLLIIMLDDVGRNDVNIGDAQSSEFTTPQLDTIRGEGLTLSNFYVNPLCGSTRASVLSGWATTRTLEETGPGTVALNRAGDYWPEAVQAGRSYIALGLFGKSGIGESQTPSWLAQADPLTPRATTEADGYPWGHIREFRFGFDFFAGFQGTAVPSNTAWDYRTLDRTRAGYDANDTRTWWDYPCATTNDRTNTYYASAYPYTSGEDCTTLVSEKITDDARAWIQENDAVGTPWVAWVNYSSVHTPWTDPAAENSRWCTDAACSALQQTGDPQYKMMFHVDKEIGYLVQAVNKDDTLVVILGDNGSVVGSGDKGDPTELGVNVGAILWGDAVQNTPRVSQALHSVSDFYPTILEMTGVNQISSTVATLSDDTRFNGQAFTLNGKSLMASVRDDANPGNDYIFGTDSGYRWARGLGYKYKNCECTGASASASSRMSLCGFTGDEQLVKMTGATEGAYLCDSNTCDNLTGADLTAYSALVAALTAENQYINGAAAPLSTCSGHPFL